MTGMVRSNALVPENVLFVFLTVPVPFYWIFYTKPFLADFFKNLQRLARDTFKTSLRRHIIDIF